MDRRTFAPRKAVDFIWPKTATLYSLVELFFNDGRAPQQGVLTGKYEVIELDRERQFYLSELKRVRVIKQHREVL